MEYGMEMEMRIGDGSGRGTIGKFAIPFFIPFRISISISYSIFPFLS
jgi:hypothetical protein